MVKNISLLYDQAKDFTRGKFVDLLNQKTNIQREPYPDEKAQLQNAIDSWVEGTISDYQFKVAIKRFLNTFNVPKPAKKSRIIVNGNPNDPNSIGLKGMLKKHPKFGQLFKAGKEGQKGLKGLIEDTVDEKLDKLKRGRK